MLTLVRYHMEGWDSGNQVTERLVCSRPRAHPPWRKSCLHPNSWASVLSYPINQSLSLWDSLFQCGPLSLCDCECFCGLILPLPARLTHFCSPLGTGQSSWGRMQLSSKGLHSSPFYPWAAASNPSIVVTNGNDDVQRVWPSLCRKDMQMGRGRWVVFNSICSLLYWKVSICVQWRNAKKENKW